MRRGLEIRRAGTDDVDEVVDVLSEAARWLIGRGIRQWPDPFPRARVAALVGRGDFFLARVGGESVGTFALMWSDPAFWGERPADAGFVQALAVRRAWAGRGLGERLLDWAAEQAAATGREYLRPDCLAGNLELRRYCERLGFEPRGEVAVDDFTSALYERGCGAGQPAGHGTPVQGQRGGQGPAPARPVDGSACNRGKSVTDTREPRSYARSGSEGGPTTPPTEGGGAPLRDDSGAPVEASCRVARVEAAGPA